MLFTLITVCAAYAAASDPRIVHTGMTYFPVDGLVQASSDTLIPSPGNVTKDQANPLFGEDR